MTQRKLACIVLAAGKGTRMKSDLPKPLHKVAGLPMVKHVLREVESLNPEKIVVVTGPDMADMAAAAKPHATAVQHVANGTGGAALAAREALKDFDGDILVVFGDMPLMTAETMKRMVEARRQMPSVGLAFSGIRSETNKSYGRMILDGDGSLARIVEMKDATEEQKKITLCNGGVICADGAKLFEWLSQIGNDNAQKEYYLTSLPEIARRDNRITQVVEVGAEEMEGANTRVELARLEKLMQQRLREKHMLNGATLTDPDTVFFSHDTVIGQDVSIGASVVFGEGVAVANGAEILPFCHIEGASIGKNASIGPFARLRPGSVIGEGAKVGNFVETKNTTLGKGAKASHLSYIGDADVGEKANIGAGAITCNYDGDNKHRTSIGAEAFIGSNTALVAPVTVGKNAIVAAGSTVTEDVPDNALALARTRQVNKSGGAEKTRAKRQNKPKP